MNNEDIISQLSDYFKTQPVLKAWLFGSFSRGEQKEDSDIEIMGEAANMPTSDSITSHPATPWKMVRGMRPNLRLQIVKYITEFK